LILCNTEQAKAGFSLTPEDKRSIKMKRGKPDKGLPALYNPKDKGAFPKTRLVLGNALEKAVRARFFTISLR
jgi:hypothetical protein